MLLVCKTVFTEEPVISGVTLMTICITSNYTLRKNIVNIFNSIFFNLKYTNVLLVKNNHVKFRVNNFLKKV